MSTDLSAIQSALDAGDKRTARRLLKPLLDAAPTADLWWLAACATEDNGQEIGCLRRALKLDSRHPAARLRYNQLRQDALMPALEDLMVEDLPPLDALTVEPPLVRRSVDIQAIKAAERRRKSRSWTRLGCLASLLMSLTFSYIGLTVTGSPIAAQVRRIMSGEAPLAPASGQPIFGRPEPTSQTRPGLPADIDQPDIPGVEFTPSGPLPTPDGNSQTYADDAAAAGFQVQPNKSVNVAQGKPVSDVLDPGFAHEYTFNTSVGDEVAIAIQFFSPTATQVETNVAILDGDGVNAESHCERDNIFIDGSGAAFICQVHKGGSWRLQVFGSEGQSTGVYVVTYEKF